MANPFVNGSASKPSSTKKKGTYNAALASGETPLGGITPQGQKDISSLLGNGPKFPGNAFDSQAALRALNKHNSSGPKQGNPLAGALGWLGGLLAPNERTDAQVKANPNRAHFAAPGLFGLPGSALGYTAGAGQDVTNHPQSSKTVDPSKSYDPSKSFYGGGSLNLDALNAKGNAAHQAAAAGGGGGGASGYGWSPTALPSAANFKVDLSSLPTLAPTADLSSFMALAQMESHLGDVKKPYEDVKNKVAYDAGISEAQAKAMYAALQGQLGAGAGTIAGNYDAANANAAQSEQGLAAQVANTYGAGSSSANAQAQALGMGSLGGQVADNSLAASQGALGNLQSGLQATQAENNGDKAAALAANSDLKTATGERSAQDVGNMAMAASDAQARVGVAEGNAYNQAAQASAALGGNLWSTALSNNLGAFNANIGLWGAKTNAGLSAAQQAEQAWAAQNGMSLQGAQLGETQREYDMGYGLNEAQYLASVLGAKNAANQQAYQDFTKLISNSQLYNGTQPGSVAAMNNAFQNTLAANPYGASLPKFPKTTSLSSNG